MGRHPRRLLVLSNGHGEDWIGASIIRRLRDLDLDLEIHAYPLVGQGVHYHAMGLPIIGHRSLLPAGGFTLFSLDNLRRDLRAGWLSTHMRQYQTMRTKRGQYGVALAVGDVIPVLAARIARIPYLFISSAKSAYYDWPYGFNSLEKWLLRRNCLGIYPRDDVSADELRQAGLPVAGVGNCMLDDLPNHRLPEPHGALIVAVLPGSRSDCCMQIGAVIQILRYASDLGSSVRQTRFLFAMADDIEASTLVACIEGWGLITRAVANGFEAHLPGGPPLEFHWGSFGEILLSSTIAIGLAGTANEQAAALGLPLLSFPTGGLYGERYLAMKKQLLGEAQWLTDGTPANTLAALETLLQNAHLRARMGAVGRQRMGPRGAAAAVAMHIANLFRYGSGSATTSVMLTDPTARA